MRAMILAAGLGTRLRPITDGLPKPLVPVAGRPNIERIIEHLKRHGITEIVINLHHLAGTLRRALSDGSALGVSIEYSLEEGEILGTGGGIRRAAPMLGRETFVVVNGDVLFTPDIGRALAVHRERGALATLVVREDPRSEELGPVGLDDAGRVRRLVSAGTAALGPRTHMFTGVHVIEPALLAHLPEKGCIVRGTYMPMVEAGGPIQAVPDRGYFCDLGTPSSLLEANSALVTGRARIDGFAPPADGRYVSPLASLGAGCTVSKGTVICDRARIAPGVSVARCLVMAGASVDADVAGSIICPDGLILAA